MDATLYIQYSGDNPFGIVQSLERRVSKHQPRTRARCGAARCGFRETAHSKGDQRQPCSDLGVGKLKLAQCFHLRFQRQNVFDVPQISSEARSDAVLS